MTDEQLAAVYAAEEEAYLLDDEPGAKLILERLEAAGWTLVRRGERKVNSESKR